MVKTFLHNFINFNLSIFFLNENYNHALLNLGSMFDNEGSRKLNIVHEN